MFKFGSNSKKFLFKCEVYDVNQEPLYPNPNDPDNPDDPRLDLIILIITTVILMI